MRSRTTQAVRHRAPITAAAAQPPATTRGGIESAPAAPIDERPATVPALHSAAAGGTQNSIAALSHDVRQPLASLNMNLLTAMRLLKRHDPRVEEALDALSDCVGAGRDVIDLLGHASGQPRTAGQPKPPLSLNVLARDVLTALWNLEPQHTGRVSARLADQAPCVVGQVAPLRHALIRVVRHALLADATPPMHLVLETRRTADQGHIRVNGVPVFLALGPMLRGPLAFATTLARHLRGMTSLELRGPNADIVVSLPLVAAASPRPTGDDREQ